MEGLESPTVSLQTVRITRGSIVQGFLQFLPEVCQKPEISRMQLPSSDVAELEEGFAIFYLSTLATSMPPERQSIEKVDSLFFHLCWLEKAVLLSLL